jgi:Poly(ADP-ribose) polymerase and DNA-Ligase Zn-finger region
MSEDDAAAEPPIEEQLPPYVIEGARSARSRCKTCQRKIDKDVLRIGILIEGPYGTGYMWHHLKCAARRQMDKVEEAYELEAWKEAKVPPEAVPPLEELRELREEAEARRAQRRELPYAELAPSGRSKCKHCGEPIAKDDPRVVLGREIEFGRQTRTNPINVHPRCVAAELLAPDTAHEPEGLLDALRRHSAELGAVLEQVVRDIGPLG